MSDHVTYDTPKNKCPYCGASLDLATDFTEINSPKEKRPPTEGDLCVCRYCAEVLEFKPDGSLQQATLKNLMELDKKQHKAISHTQEWVREHRKDPIE